MTVATLTPVLPEPGAANGAAVIVAPGGGFMFLSMSNEGWEVAQALADQGVAAFVLKYRVGQGGGGQGVTGRCCREGVPEVGGAARGAACDQLCRGAVVGVRCALVGVGVGGGLEFGGRRWRRGRGVASGVGEGQHGVHAGGVVAAGPQA